MSLAELVIVSVKVEGRSKSEVAHDFRISRYWVQQVVKRYEVEEEGRDHPSHVVSRHRTVGDRQPQCHSPGTGRVGHGPRPQDDPAQ